MSDPLLYSIIESPGHPDFSALYKKLQIRELQFKAMRRAMSQLKQQPPELVVAEFFYGYANNYAGVNISNLDVFLFSLQKYAPNARVLVLVSKKEHGYVDPLRKIFPLHAVLTHPVTPAEMESSLMTALK